MPQSVQNDLKEGARTRWLATPALVAAIPAASFYSGMVQPQTVPPWASIRCEPIGREEFMPATPGQPYVDKLRLVVSVWAVKQGLLSGEDVVGDLIGLVRTAYADESWGVPDSTLLAVYPEPETNAAEEGTYQGEDIWRAEAAFEIWLQRTKAAVG